MDITVKSIGMPKADDTRNNSQNEENMSFLNPYDNTPDFVNELGTKWWRDESMTNWAQKKDLHGTTLDMVCFFIELTDGTRTRVLVCKNTQEIVEEDASLEGMACKIDVRKMLVRDQEREVAKSTSVPAKKSNIRGVKGRRSMPPAPSLERR